MGLLCSRSDTPFGGLRSQSLPLKTPTLRRFARREARRNAASSPFLKLRPRKSNHPVGWRQRSAADGTFLLAIRHAFRRSSLAKPAAQNADTTAFCPPRSAAERGFKSLSETQTKKKQPPSWVVAFSWCGRWDLNPYACAHAPQTCLSANSSTAAHHVIIAVGASNVNSFFANS